MENTKKMLLVEPDFIERLKRNENLPENVSSRLDGEMQKILKSKMNDREKWALYSQALQRFLHFIETDRRPFKIPIVMEGVDQLNNESNDLYSKVNKKEESENNASITNKPLPEGDVTTTATESSGTNPETIQFSPSRIVDNLPKSYEKKTRTLLNIIISNKPKIWWKTNGEVVINNRTIPDSNILDLVSDTVRSLKRPKPTGWEEFALLLKDIKVPTSCIGNPTNLDFISRPRLTESNTSPAPISTRPSSSSSFKDATTSTPLSSGLVKANRKKLAWERWTPY